MKKALAAISLMFLCGCATNTVRITYWPNGAVYEYTDVTDFRCIPSPCDDKTIVAVGFFGKYKGYWHWEYDTIPWLGRVEHGSEVVNGR
jgi:hypothetical protein